MEVRGQRAKRGDTTLERGEKFANLIRGNSCPIGRRGKWKIERRVRGGKSEVRFWKFKGTHPYKSRVAAPAKSNSKAVPPAESKTIGRA